MKTGLFAFALLLSLSASAQTRVSGYAPGQNEEVIDLVPCFDPSVIHVPPIITETIKTCIKNYYHEFLSTLK